MDDYALNEECDDSPSVTSDLLVSHDCPYQQAIRIVQSRALTDDDICIMHAAIRDVIVSKDIHAGEALEYLTECGVTRALPNEESFVVLAASQHDAPAYIDMLVALAMVDCNFNDRDVHGVSAYEMIEKRAPGIVKRIIKEANEVNAGCRC